MSRRYITDEDEDYRYEAAMAARERRIRNHRIYADPFCGCPICEPDEPEDDQNADTDEEAGA